MTKGERERDFEADSKEKEGELWEFLFSLDIHQRD